MAWLTAGDTLAHVLIHLPTIWSYSLRGLHLALSCTYWVFVPESPSCCSQGGRNTQWGVQHCPSHGISHARLPCATPAAFLDL